MLKYLSSYTLHPDSILSVPTGHWLCPAPTKYVYELKQEAEIQDHKHMPHASNDSVNCHQRNL